jgi:exonuclease III
MRILSLNCWGGRADPQGILNYLAETDADVYCLQEVYCAPSSVPEFLTYSGEPGLPVRPHLFREIAKALPEHRGYFYPAAQGYLGDTQRVSERVGYGIAAFVRSTIPILSERMKFVFGEFRHRGWGDPPLPRNAHGVRLLCPQTGNAVVVVHLHGLWMPNGKADCTEREAQARRLRGLVWDMTGSPADRVVVCGDFNVLPESSTFRTLSDLVPRNLIREFGITDTRTSFYKKNVSRHADYALVSENVRVERFEAVAHPEVSDHRPLLLEFS